MNSINPLFNKNQMPTSPPWIPMQFHKEPLSLIFTIDRNIPSKINPKRNPAMFQKISCDKLWTKLKIIACKAIDIFVPYSNFNSSSNQPLKIISSANPTPNPSRIEFKENTPSFLAGPFAQNIPNPIGSFSAILILLLLCIFYSIKSKKIFS